MPRRRTATLRHAAVGTWLALLATCGPAVAAESSRSPLPDATAPFGVAGWVLVVGLGVLAIAAGALTIGRSRRPDPRQRAHDQPVLDAPGSAPPNEAASAAPEPEAAVDATSTVRSPDRTRAPLAIAESASAAEPRRAAAAVAASAPADVEPEVVAGSTPAAPVASPGAPALLALRHVDLSIDVLRRHLDREPRPMPAVWVMLLDLCRTHGREQRFRELAVEFHQRFNVRTPKWERYPPDRGEPGLEAYPRLIREITAAWGTHDCRRLLERLLYDNRGSSRRGFALNAYNDLIALRRAAGAVMETIDADVALEAQRRDAIARSTGTRAEAPANDASAAETGAAGSDLTGEGLPAEPRQTGLADALAHEWGEAALAGRLCEMLARGGGAQPPSDQAAEQLELLQRMAERVGGPGDVALAANG
jgi:hypothetical protein